MYTVVKDYHVPHSIYFGDKNSWDDWHLVSPVRPFFQVPSQKTNSVEIPGTDGIIDLSEALTGFPTFNNREGTFQFIVVNGFGNWVEKQNEILTYLHGTHLKAVLEDDPDYYYEGRFEVQEWSSTTPWSTITVKYSVAPYKYWKWPSTGWLWDPFVFAKDKAIKTPFSRIQIDSESYETKDFGGSENFGDAPVCPEFRVKTTDNKGIYVKYKNDSLNIDEELHFPNGNTKNPAVVFYRNTPYTFQVKGHGSFSMNFKIGRF